MKLIDKLLAIDKGEVEKIPTEEVKAIHLSKVMGEDVKITIRAIPGERYMELTSTMVNSKGKLVFGKAYDAYALIAVEGIAEPSMKEPELMKHFGCASPKDLVKALFPGGELNRVADKISELSGFDKEEEQEEEIKN